jgi:hypothetical protein
MAKNDSVKDALIKRINRKLAAKQQKVKVVYGTPVMLSAVDGRVVEDYINLSELALQLGVKENHLVVEGVDGGDAE